MSSSSLTSQRRTGRDFVVVSAAAVLALTVTSCGSSGEESLAGARVVNVELTDAGCDPSPASIEAGPVTFEVTNDGANGVTEGELKQGATTLGESENLTPGKSGSFSLRLEPGSYAFVCPNATRDSWPFTVTESTATASAQSNAADLEAATDGYRKYVIAEVALLQVANKKFTDAVRAGDITEAKKQFALAREHYETIEPVAESFGDLDPKIDLREADIEKGDTWTGFHRIEKALWVNESLKGMEPIADQLDADLKELARLVAKARYQPAQLGNGATELLNEVGASKITGEEDIFSHTDLYDFQANLDGARKAFELLAPALVKVDAALAATIRTEFANVQTALDKYKSADGFVDYSTVTQVERRVLTQKVDALAEPLSQVAGKIA